MTQDNNTYFVDSSGEPELNKVREVPEELGVSISVISWEQELEKSNIVGYKIKYFRWVLVQPGGALLRTPVLRFLACISLEYCCNEGFLLRFVLPIHFYKSELPTIAKEPSISYTTCLSWRQLWEWTWIDFITTRVSIIGWGRRAHRNTHCDQKLQLQKRN